MIRAQELAPPLAHAWRKILCAVDFSDSSRASLELAADLARRTGAELTILHVADEPAPGLEDSREARERREHELERGLARFKLYAAQYLDAPVQTKLLGGPAATEILSFAQQGRFDLVVTGTHGRSGMRRLVLGSVAEHVLRHAPCPVMVARAPPPEPPSEAGE